MSRPPGSIILLHGLGSSFDHNWRRTGWVDILADFGCDAPEIDLPGHGRATRSHDPNDYNSMDVDVFNSLPSETPMTAVGFSAGARLLLRMAMSHPESFDKIVLLGVGDGVFESGDSGSNPLADALLRDEEPEDIQMRLFYRLAESSGNDRRAMAAFLRRPHQAIREEDLSAVTCPTLVVLGERDDPRGAYRLVTALPFGTLVTLAGVDHFSTPSNFEAIDATMRFLGLG